MSGSGQGEVRKSLHTPCKILLKEGDLLAERVDAIVCSVPSRWEKPKEGSLERAIEKATGSDLEDKKREWRGERLNKAGNPAHWTVGSVVSSEAYQHLRALNVVHVVSPTIVAGHTITRLKECQAHIAYRHLLQEADRLQARTLALPILGSGSSRIPQAMGFAIAMMATLVYLETENSGLRSITFVAKVIEPACTQIWPQDQPMLVSHLSVAAQRQLVETAVLTVFPNEERGIFLIGNSTVPSLVNGYRFRAERTSIRKIIAASFGS